MQRRRFLSTSAIYPWSASLACASFGARAQAPVAKLDTGLGRKTINIVDLGADTSGKEDAWVHFQRAIDMLKSSGGVLYIPAGTYRIGKPLEWLNPVNARQPGILFQGEGVHASILKSVLSNGPLLRIRGVPQRGPISTTFFWGGGIKDLTFDGTSGGPANDAIEVLGWYYGEIYNCHFTGFSGHGVRVISDLKINPNPDFTSSTIFVRGTWIDRCGGWGYIDDGGVQAAPGWSWDRCVFAMCRLGGARVCSSSLSFTKCSFSGCGWQSEKQAAPSVRTYGLYFDGALTAASRHWVEGCEFDTNYSGHIGIRFLGASSFINNRFIFNDRYGAGRLCPEVGVEIGSGDARAAVRSVEFRQSFFRFDRGGQATGFDWLNVANVRDVVVVNSTFSGVSDGTLKLTRYRGFNPSEKAKSFGYSIVDRDAEEERPK